MLVGPTFYSAIAGLMHGNGSGELIGLFSAVGDTITLALTAPILMTALALRGGLVAWPWIFFTASMLAWLGYDVQGGLGFIYDKLHLEMPEWLSNGIGMFKIAACTLSFAAGLAQRRVIRAQDL